MKVQTYICIVKRFWYCPLLFTLDGYKQLGVYFFKNETNWIRTTTTFVSQSEVINDYTCNTSMLGSCNCPFKGKSNLFRGSFFFCSFFIVLTRFLSFFSFLCIFSDLLINLMTYNDTY